MNIIHHEDVDMAIINEANSGNMAKDTATALKTYKCQICSKETKGSSEAMMHLIDHGSILLNAVTGLIKDQDAPTSSPTGAASTPTAAPSSQTPFGVSANSVPLGEASVLPPLGAKVQPAATQSVVANASSAAVPTSSPPVMAEPSHSCNNC